MRHRFSCGMLLFLFLFFCPYTLAEGSTSLAEDQSDSKIPYHSTYTLSSIPGATFCDRDTSILFIRYSQPNQYESYFTLYEYDKETGEVDTFCKDAACRHTSPSCVAYCVDGNIEIFEGNVYALRSWPNTAKSTATILVNERFVDIVDAIDCFRCYGNWLYGWAGGTFIRVPIGGGSHTIIQEDFACGLRVIIGNYLYTTVDGGYTLARIDLEKKDFVVERLIEDCRIVFRYDGENIYYQNKQDGFFYRCDLDGTNATPIPLAKATRLCFDEEYIYYCAYDVEDYYYPDNGKVFRLKRTLDDEPELICETGGFVQDLYTVYQMDEIFIMNGDGVFMVGKDGRNYRQLELP